MQLHIFPTNMQKHISHTVRQTDRQREGGLAQFEITAPDIQRSRFQYGTAAQEKLELGKGGMCQPCRHVRHLFFSQFLP